MLGINRAVDSRVSNESRSRYAGLMRFGGLPAGARVAHLPGARVYVVQADGSVRRAIPKARGKAATRAAKRARIAVRS
jgi:hypothetical protein